MSIHLNTPLRCKIYIIMVVSNLYGFNISLIQKPVDNKIRLFFRIEFFHIDIPKIPVQWLGDYHDYSILYTDRSSSRRNVGTVQGSAPQNPVWQEAPNVSLGSASLVLPNPPAGGEGGFWKKRVITIDVLYHLF